MAEHQGHAGDTQVILLGGQDKGGEYTFVIAWQLRRCVQQSDGALDDVAAKQGACGKEIGAQVEVQIPARFEPGVAT